MESLRALRDYVSGKMRFGVKSFGYNSKNIGVGVRKPTSQTIQGGSMPGGPVKSAFKERNMVTFMKSGRKYKSWTLSKKTIEKIKKAKKRNKKGK